MKVSYNWLNSKYFDGKLPAPEKVAEELTFHAWEIEETVKVGDDTMIDVKVLPDKAMWALSHRGIAKDLSAILNLPLADDPLSSAPTLEPKADFRIEIDSPNCRRFAAALIKGVKVGPSSPKLKAALETIGQRSINNVVDASNYVMFDLGQPSHAFDAKNLPGGVSVRQAKAGETLAALDENEYTFTENDTLISSLTGEALSIAGIKGGKHSGITDDTTDILVEVANWDPVTTRKTASRLKLRSDASSRYENGIVPEMVPFGLKAVVDLILKEAGGEVVGYQEVVKEVTSRKDVSVTTAKVNSVLGLSLTNDIIADTFKRLGLDAKVSGDTFTVTPPFERTDLNIPEDLIEEIGRIYGYEHVAAVTPEPIVASGINKRFYYSESIRDILLQLGFSEIYTSSFREKDEVKLSNAFAADKGYLRSSLVPNMREALAKNAPNADLLGLKQVKTFEIGTVFGQSGETFMLALGVMSPPGYKAKSDEPALAAAVEALKSKLGMDVAANIENGVAEIDLGYLLSQLPEPSSYEPAPKPIEVTYKPFSVYPAMSRDIAMWVPGEVSGTEIEVLLKEQAGELCVRITLFDRFEKEGKTSYAYRLVFQSKEKTLTGAEVDAIMDGIYSAVRERGFEVR